MRIPESKRLVWLISILLVAGFLATSLASYYVSKGVVKNAIVSRELPITSDNVYSEIQRDILRPVFISAMMAHDTFLRDWVVRGEKNPEEMVKYLNEVVNKNGMFTSFFVSEKTRQYYHPSGVLKKINPDALIDKWYFRVREMRPDYEINVDPDEVNQNTFVIYVNYRVFDYNGNFIGATGVGLAVDSVKALIDSYQERYNRNIYFVDRGGKLALKGMGMSRVFVGLKDDPGLKKIADKILSSKTGSFQYRNNSNEVVLINTRFIPELQWYLLVEQGEDASISGLRKTLYGNLAVSFGVTLVILLATNFTITFYQRRLEKLATTDSLTGLLNRLAFNLVYDQALRDMQRLEKPLSVIISDLDYFKKINDLHGHAVGDEAIVVMAQVLRSTVRLSDVCCRWGGEEFLVLLPDCTGEQALALAEKIRSAVSFRLVEREGRVVTMTASFGAAQKKPGESMDSLIHRADLAMYSAKEAGRNNSRLAQ
ncbi:MAG: GGDEF domain-containing protein [Nitrospinae bacterium]|nr:GGDEF domain-containing protein [Nitrospinota bacterium]